MQPGRNGRVKELARECGFELSGVTPALPLVVDGQLYRHWVETGYAGDMRYLTDHRGEIRLDPRRLLPSAQSVISVGKLYNTPIVESNRYGSDELAWISRYAWGDDYHDVLRQGLERLVTELTQEMGSFEYKVCVDTAPLLERSYARMAGLGWIGRNTCLIHEGKGSWFFLGELLTSLDIEPDSPPPDRCGTCTRCLDACPTQALVPAGDGRYTLDSRLCISYLTIELRGPIPEQRRAGNGRHLFGCDICQDVCPWNSQAPAGADPAFLPKRPPPPLIRLAAISEEEFDQMFRGTAVTRTRYRGFLRNVAVAMGNLRRAEFRAPLERLTGHADPVVAEHARWALARLPH